MALQTVHLKDVLGLTGKEMDPGKELWSPQHEQYGTVRASVLGCASTWEADSAAGRGLKRRATDFQVRGHSLIARRLNSTLL